MKTSRLALALCLVVGILAPSTWAAAVFLESDVSSGSFRAATLEIPLGVSASISSCTNPPNPMRSVTVVWTPTVSPLADGYDVERASGSSAFNLLAHVAVAGSSSYVDNTPSASTLYKYRVRASYHSWRSQPSVAATLTTPAANCK